MDQRGWFRRSGLFPVVSKGMAKLLDMIAALEDGQLSDDTIREIGLIHAGASGRDHKLKYLTGRIFESLAANLPKLTHPVQLAVLEILPTDKYGKVLKDNEGKDYVPLVTPAAVPQFR